MSELLIAIGIIAVLIAVLLPGYRRVLAQSRQVQCLGNLRQYGAAALVFIGENQGIPRWDGLKQANATEGSTYPAWEAWVRPYLHKRQADRLRCPNITSYARSSSDFKYAFNYSGNSALAIYYPRLRTLPVPANRVVLAGEFYGYDGFNHAVHFNMTMWGLTESNASGPGSDFATHESAKAQYHGDPQHRSMNLFFLDGHAAPVSPPKGTDWRNEPTYGTSTNNGYFYDRRQFRALSENSSL